MKTEFDLQIMGPLSIHLTAKLKIIGRTTPYVKIEFSHFQDSFIILPEKDLKEIANNILRALEENNKSTTMNWTTTKPTEPCVFVTAIWRNGQWFYEVFELSQQRNPNGEYMLLDNEGNLEYFGINDFKADKYCVLPKNQQQ